MDLVLRIFVLVGSESIFRNHKGQAIMIPHIPHDISNGDGVDFPVPVGILDMRVVDKLVGTGNYREDEFALVAGLVQFIWMLLCICGRPFGSV